MCAYLQPLHQFITVRTYNQVFWVKLFESKVTLLLKHAQPNISLLTPEELQNNSHSHAKIPFVEHFGTTVLAIYSS